MVNAALKQDCNAATRGRGRRAASPRCRERRRAELISAEAEAREEPRPRRRLGWASALLLPATAAAIIANALILQEVPHPDPLFTTRPLPDIAASAGPSGLALPNPRPHLRDGAGQSAAADGDPVVFAVQQALARAGYGPLSPDGLLGPRTGDAVRRFQLDEGLAVTGHVDEALIRRLAAVGALDGE